MKKITLKKKKFALPVFLVILSWIIVFLFISYGYASFSSQLDVYTTAMIEESVINENFDISDMGVGSSSGAASAGLSRMGKEIKGTVISDTCGGYVIYDFTIMNKTPWLAYIQDIDVKSLTNDQGLPTTGFDIELINVTPNVTYIEAYESRIIKVKITNNCTTNDTLANFIFEYAFTLVKYYEYTLNATPSDANITITTSRDKTLTGIGSVTANIYEGDTINYSVSKYLYDTNSSSIIMPSENYSTNVVLNHSPSKTLTYSFTPSDATISCNDTVTNEFLFDHKGNGNSTVYLGQKLNCSVSHLEYYYTKDSNNNFIDYTGNVEITGDNTFNVTLNEKPWIDNTFKNSEFSEATTGFLLNYHPGYYLIELWGGTGGRDYQEKSSNSNAGYIYATVYLKYNDMLYYTLGGNGEDGKLLSTSQGGANGGGNGPAIYPGGGGGYSAVAINTQTIDQTNINNGNVLLIAGGGGGSGSGYLPSSKPSYGPGGSGGTLSSTSTINSIGYVYYGSDGGGNAARAGGGGTTVGGAGAPNNNGKYAESGSLLKGGNANTNGLYTNGGAGGAGYYGGGGGAGQGRTSDGSGSGGGGSSLISTVLERCTPGNTRNGTLIGENPSSSGGGVIIKFVGR